MGSGISTVCGSKRSVLIANSVRKLPPIPENDVNSDIETELEIKPSSGKLHPADSRDSGIGENDIPNFPFNRDNVPNFLKNSSVESSPEKSRYGVQETERAASSVSSRPSRPQSCRLGHRGSSQDVTKKSRKAEVSESQIRRLVKSAKGKTGIPALDLDSKDKGFESSDNDTLSNNSSSSPTRDARPKSARRKVFRKTPKSKHDGNMSARTISDLDSSTDTESQTSDTDMLSIPDETGVFRGTPRRRGWVRNEDFTDVSLSASMTPRAGAVSDSYRIVSGTFSDVDVNLAKKASERSISSIILTPADAPHTPTSTNSEWFDARYDSQFHTEGSGRHDDVNGGPGLEACPSGGDERATVWAIVTSHKYDRLDAMWRVRSEGMPVKSLDDLVTSLIIALERQKQKGPCTQADYENVMKSLRYQLVAMAMNYMSRQSTPRIEVQGEQSTLFSDDSWRVQIRLRTEDEEILESSEHSLAKRLAQKGSNISRDDISILLADHLRTIEKLQQVQDSGLLREQDRGPTNINLQTTPRLSASEGEIHRAQEGPSMLRKSSPSDSTGNKCPVGVSNRLPPSGQTKTKKGNNLRSSQKPRGNNADVVVTSEAQGDQDSLQSSPESKSKTRKILSESGIDSECEDTETFGFEDEEAFLTAELIEACRLLWEVDLSDADLADLLPEYRRRQSDIFTAHGYTSNSETTKSGDAPGSNDEKKLQNRRQQQSHMGQTTGKHHLQHLQEVQLSDQEFVAQYRERKKGDDLTFETFCDLLADHMKKTRLIRVQSFRENGLDFGGDRSHSFSGFGPPRQNSFGGHSNVVRQHSFSGAIMRQNSYGSGGSRQNSFLRSLPNSRQGSFCRTRSRGSTGSSNTFSTTSSGITSDADDRAGSISTKSSVSREISFGMLNEFEDIEEIEESRGDGDAKAGLLPPSGRKQQTAPRASSANLRDRERRRAGQTQVHGLGPTPVEPLRKIEEDSMPKVEEVRQVVESKLSVRSRPDSGIAVSTSSASYSSSDALKEADDIEDGCAIPSSQEMVEKVSKVRAEQHNDMKSLVAAVTKGLNTEQLKAHALYCWLTSQELKKFTKANKKSSSPAGRLKQLSEKKTSYSTIYIDMLKVAGLKCERIDGYVKSKDYLPGNTVQTAKFQHSWVAVFIDGHYRLVDPQYGATGEKFAMDHYFVTSPDELILSHFPKDPRWMMMNQMATVEGFEGTLKTWPAMFHFQIRPLNMKSVIRTYDGRLSITVLLQNVAVNPQLEYAGPGPEIDSDTLEEQIDHEIRDVDNAETYHVNLPQEGNYYFTVFAHVLEECVDIPVFQYRIEYQDELL